MEKLEALGFSSLATGFWIFQFAHLNQEGSKDQKPWGGGLYPVTNFNGGSKKYLQFWTKLKGEYSYWKFSRGEGIPYKAYTKSPISPLCSCRYNLNQGGQDQPHFDEWKIKWNQSSSLDNSNSLHLRTKMPKLFSLTDSISQDIPNKMFKDLSITMYQHQKWCTPLNCWIISRES